MHRSGRSARGSAEGSSIMLIGPEDVRSYRNICRALNRGTYMYSVMQVPPIYYCGLVL